MAVGKARERLHGLGRGQMGRPAAVARGLFDALRFSDKPSCSRWNGDATHNNWVGFTASYGLAAGRNAQPAKRVNDVLEEPCMLLGVR